MNNENLMQWSRIDDFHRAMMQSLEEHVKEQLDVGKWEAQGPVQLYVSGSTQE